MSEIDDEDSCRSKIRIGIRLVQVQVGAGQVQVQADGGVVWWCGGGCAVQGVLGFLARGVRGLQLQCSAM